MYRFAWLNKPGPSAEQIQSGQRLQMSNALQAIDPKIHSLLSKLTDVHNHAAGFGPVERSNFSKELDEIRQGRHMHAKGYCVMSVEPGDWGYAASWGAEDGASVNLRQAIGECTHDRSISCMTWR